MIKSLQVIILITVSFTFMCKPSNLGHQDKETILIDSEYLENTKMRLEKNDPKIKDAFDQMIEDAQAALKEGPFSVTDKEKLPPSGDTRV